MDVNEWSDVKDFAYNKRLGQNFITDGNLLDAIVSDSGVTAADTVLEIGAGAGTLTRRLARKAARVVTVEIDRRLGPALSDTLKGTDNVELIFGDFLRLTPGEIRAATKGEFAVVANLPYYITTPIIFYFLENDLPVKSLTLMVQREVADRLTAVSGPAYGALSAAVAVRCEVRVTRRVGREMFTPRPAVDSAVVSLHPVKRSDIKDRDQLSRLIACAFAMRRKTLVNNLIACGVPRAAAEGVLSGAGFGVRTRGEALRPEEFVALSSALIQNNIFLR